MILGEIYSWQTFLGGLIKNKKWKLAMGYGLQVYAGKIRKLSQIQENIELRNIEMKELF